jgi:hypothetical protein
MSSGSFVHSDKIGVIVTDQGLRNVTDLVKAK